MQLLLDHSDSPYIRGIGFLYLRYAGDPTTVYDWIEPYLYDDEPIDVAANSNKNNNRRLRKEPETIGDFVRKLFSERDFYGTMLPRLPIHIERDIQVKLLLAEKIQNRAKKHLSNSETMKYFQTLGSRVMALYGDEENPTTWYEGVIDRVVTRNEETGQPLKTPKFVVTFPEYGNTEVVTLGEMEMKGVPLDPVGASIDHSQDREEKSYKGGGSYDRDRGRGYGGRGRYDDHHRSSGRSGKNDLYDEVLRREQASVTASGHHDKPRKSSTAPVGRNIHQPKSQQQRETYSHSTEERTAPAAASAPKKRSADDIAAIQEKKRKLMAKYG
jgi:pre-mRNA-splicing factor 38B